MRLAKGKASSTQRSQASTPHINAKFDKKLSVRLLGLKSELIKSPKVPKGHSIAPRLTAVLSQPRVAASLPATALTNPSGSYIFSSLPKALALLQSRRGLSDA